MKAVLSFETSVSILHQSTRIVPSHKTWIFINTTVTASNLDKNLEIVLHHHKFTVHRQRYLPTIPIFFLRERERGGYCRGLRGTRSLNMNKCPISPQSPAGASKDVYVLCRWVYGVSKVVKKMWGVGGWFCRETAVSILLRNLYNYAPKFTARS